MGQKTNPISNRQHISPVWQSRWFAKQNYAKYLVEDLKIRRYVRERLESAGLGAIEITRSKDRLDISITTSKPGLVIGRGGQGINQLRSEIKSKFFKDGGPSMKVDILEERKPDTVASMVAQNIGSQIERRIPYRRACRQALEKSMSNKEVRGIRVTVAGRLNGAEIARNESFQEGSMPLSRFNNKIDFAVYAAKTTYGIIGVKVWIDRGPSEEIGEEDVITP